MGKFIEGIELSTEVCCNCGILFAMPADMQRRRRDDHKWFYCPAGHEQHYTGATEAQRLQRELDRKAEMLANANARAETAERDRRSIAKAHQKMRVRVMNGVCPCCNRTFQNLMQHMRSEHPDFSEIRTLLALRQAFGMTQEAVAVEAGVTTPQVSLYERGRNVPAYAKESLDHWVEQHTGATP